MSDDLIEELNFVLRTDNENITTKLQSYFCVGNDKDDLFSNLLHGDVAQTFENSDPNCYKQNLLDDSKKSINFSVNINRDMSTPGNAWLHCESTKSILSKILSKETSPTSVNKLLLARPQLYTDPSQRISDPIFTILAENYNHDLATEMRKIPSFDENKFTEKEVLSLLERGWIRPALDLISRILNKIGFSYAKLHSVENTTSNFTVQIGQLWCLRFSLLARMKMISILESELSGFQNLDSPNLYSEFYCDNSSLMGIKGSLIPFSMRLIYAEIPFFSNKFSDALNRLYYILAVIKRIIINIESGYSEDGTRICHDEIFKNNALKIWHKRRNRVFISCMRVLLVSKDYPSVIDIIHNLIHKSTNDITFYEKHSLFHLLGRVYLQLGDIDNACFYFEQSIVAFKDESSDDLINKNNIIKFKVSFQNALINICRNNFEEAKKGFQQCLEFCPDNSLVLNNYCVCCLYLKQVQEAICVLEKLLMNGIHKDGIIFNLCILYELQSNQIKTKKLKLVKILSEYDGDDFNISSFKLSNSE